MRPSELKNKCIYVFMCYVFIYLFEIILLFCGAGYSPPNGYEGEAFHLINATTALVAQLIKFLSLFN